MTGEPDWGRLQQSARRIARRYVSACDADDIVQDAMVQLVELWARGKYDPQRGAPDTYHGAHLSHAVWTAAARSVYGDTGLSDEECRDAFRRWDGASRAEQVATLTRRYRSKGYAAASAERKAERVVAEIATRPQVVSLDAMNMSRRRGQQLRGAKYDNSKHQRRRTKKTPAEEA